MVFVWCVSGNLAVIDACVDAVRTVSVSYSTYSQISRPWVYVCIICLVV